MWWQGELDAEIYISDLRKKNSEILLELLECQLLWCKAEGNNGGFSQYSGKNFVKNLAIVCLGPKLFLLFEKRIE